MFFFTKMQVSNDYPPDPVEGDISYTNRFQWLNPATGY
jgi:hypothetical protein